jgi:DNA phosphorothioation-associated putative methyltransferase
LILGIGVRVARIPYSLSRVRRCESSARFGKGRRPPSGPPASTQRDIKAFLGTYRRGCEEANTLLFSVGQPAVIDQACRRSAVGHLVENALLVRRDALEALEPVLRVDEGCARALVGGVGANLLKLQRFSAKVTYLVCPGLDREAEPTVELRVKVTLPALAIEVFDYSRREERPRLGVGPGLLRGTRESDLRVRP